MTYLLRLCFPALCVPLCTHPKTPKRHQILTTVLAATASGSSDIAYADSAPHTEGKSDDNVTQAAEAGPSSAPATRSQTAQRLYATLTAGIVRRKARSGEQQQSASRTFSAQYNVGASGSRGSGPTSAPFVPDSNFDNSHISDDTVSVSTYGTSASSDRFVNIRISGGKSFSTLGDIDKMNCHVRLQPLHFPQVMKAITTKAQLINLFDLTNTNKANYLDWAAGNLDDPNLSAGLASASPEEQEKAEQKKSDYISLEKVMKASPDSHLFVPFRERWTLDNWIGSWLVDKKGLKDIYIEIHAKRISGADKALLETCGVDADTVFEVLKAGPVAVEPPKPAATEAASPTREDKGKGKATEPMCDPEDTKMEDEPGKNTEPKDQDDGWHATLKRLEKPDSPTKASSSFAAQPETAEEVAHAARINKS